MPTSKSKRRKVLDRERVERRERAAANQARRTAGADLSRALAAHGDQGFGYALAMAKGYTPITLDDLPEHMREETAEAMRVWEEMEGMPAQLYRKPDGQWSIMGAPIGGAVESGAEPTTFSVEGSYRIERNGAVADESVPWAVSTRQDDDGWWYDAHADVAGEEWEDDGGPWDSQAEAIEDARQRLAGNNGLVYGPGGDVR